MSLDFQLYSLCVFLITFAAIAVSVFWLLCKKKGVSEKNAKSTGQKHQEQKQIPEKWVLVGRVEKLIIYPIKSCQGVQVNEAVVTKLGLKFRDHNIRDRDFMLVDAKGNMQVLTANPGMSFITMTPTVENNLTLSAPGMDPITFTYPNVSTSEEKLCRVKHDNHIKAIDCGDEVANWFQEFLGTEKHLRLYYHHINETQRTFEPYMYESPQFEQSDMGTFHNETSYLMMAQESIDKLNLLLENKSSWKNFRPTILINNVAEPFAEVNWSFVRIGNGNGILKAAVPCTRCPLVTVDQEAGVLPKDGEPLKTLRKMKIEDIFPDKKLTELLKNQGIMGLRLGLFLPAGEGAVVKVEDPIYAALL